VLEKNKLRNSSRNQAQFRQDQKLPKNSKNQWVVNLLNISREKSDLTLIRLTVYYSFIYCVQIYIYLRLSHSHIYLIILIKKNEFIGKKGFLWPQKSKSFRFNILTVS
jgi:hypothetical protein